RTARRSTSIAGYESGPISWRAEPAITFSIATSSRPHSPRNPATARRGNGIAPSAPRGWWDGIRMVRTKGMNDEPAQLDDADRCDDMAVPILRGERNTGDARKYRVLARLPAMLAVRADADVRAGLYRSRRSPTRRAAPPHRGRGWSGVMRC